MTIKYKIFAIVLLQLALNIKICFNFSLCDSNNGKAFDLDQISADTLTRNTQPSNKNLFLLQNATNWLDCVQLCCSDINCNMAYFYETQTCYLVKCISDELCRPMENLDLVFPDSYLVKLRSFEDSNKAQNVLKHECDPSDFQTCPIHEKCHLNYETQIYECKCKYQRINGICREFLQHKQSCEVYLNECLKPHEECVPLNQRIKHGKCQCRIGFIRNENDECIVENNLIIINNNNNNNNKENLNIQNEVVTVTQIDDSSKQNETRKNEVNTTISLKTTATTKNNVLLTTTVNLTSNFISIGNFQASKQLYNIDKNIISDAGLDQHIYYPIRSCVLNGSNSKTLDGSQIIKWQWYKVESSPALGNFVELNGTSTSSNQIALVENLIEGEYTFMLKVWSDKSNELYGYNQMKVIVHNFNFKDDQSISRNNRVQINLNVNPFKFSDLEKLNFLSKLELLLQQPKLSIKHPKIHLTNIDISTWNGQSGILLEFYVSNNNDQIILNDNDKSLNIVDSNVVMKVLYKLKYGSNKHLLDLTINDVVQLKCNNHSSCLNHGVCDSITYKCVCKKYWLPNLYKTYLGYESDETFGKNCEWNIFYMSCTVLVFSIILPMMVYYLLRFVFYVFCCGCFGKSIKRKDKKKQDKPSFLRKLFCCKNTLKKETKYSLLEDADDSFQFKNAGKKYQQEHTYGLHSSDDEFDVSTKLNKDNDDEDVLYDQNKYSVKRKIGNNIV